MKWVVIASFIVCLATFSKGNALRGISQSKDAASSKDKEQIGLTKASIIISEVSKTNDAQCLAGSEWTSNCHTCRCSEEGQAECTRLETCEGKYDEPISCKPHTTFLRDCNLCTCLENGRALCTLRGCLPADFKTPSSKKNEENRSDLNVYLNRRIRATSQAMPKTCTPGQEFRMDCNKCLCNNEGQDFSCTRIDCTAVNNNGNVGVRVKRDATTQIQLNCEPGSVFKQGCNLCHCTEDGNHATCALKRCSDKDTQEESVLPESDPSFRCNPGEQTKRDCNDCSCSADGKSVFCTLRLCDQDITPSK